jgi:hypothetical protein
MAFATIGDAPAMPPVHELTVSRPSVPALTLPRVAVRYWLVLAVLGLTALTFVVPSAPTYDPWAWIIWGREIVHLDLSTVDGPSWKPLPVLFTVPFSLFGSLAPDLWLFVARAGAIGGVVMLFRLGRRFAGIPGGVAAAVPYALAPWTVRNAAYGNSEGLLVFLALAAVERHLDGRPRTAFLFALGAALLRPEAWPFVGLYGLWLLWREPAVRRVVIAGFAALPALWLLPEWWGSGDLLRAMHRAQNPRGNSPAFAEDPVRAILEQFHLMLAQRVWTAGMVTLGLALVIGFALRRAPRWRDITAVAILLAGAGLWVLEVALMTSDGFSGNIRYLIMPAAIVCLAAGVGIGWLANAVLGRFVAGASVLALALGVAVGLWFAQPARETLPLDHDAISYQARLSDNVPGLIARAGGPGRVKACGRVYTGPFQVPLVAWNLHLHTTQVKSLAPPVRPAVVFRAKSVLGARPGPSIRSLGGDSSGLETLSIAPGWRIVGACRGAR